MTKIHVKIILLEEGLFLFHSKTNSVLEYNIPHKFIGKLDFDKSKIIKKS